MLGLLRLVKKLKTDWPALVFCSFLRGPPLLQVAIDGRLLNHGVAPLQAFDKPTTLDRSAGTVFRNLFGGIEG